mgnify:FL=1
MLTLIAFSLRSLTLLQATTHEAQRPWGRAFARLRLVAAVGVLMPLMAQSLVAQAQAQAQAQGQGQGQTAALPGQLQARELQGQPESQAQARGDVEFRRGPLLIRADVLDFTFGDDKAVATGRVLVQREGATYRGPRLELQLQDFVGFFLRPEFDFQRAGAGGRAERIDFLGQQRLAATQALYTSCPRDGSGDPAWMLTARRVELDLQAQEGVAEGARLEFLGAPLLVWPRLSFPTSDARRSGWLPPNINLDSRSGFEVAVPYYFNLAPNRDATLTPKLATRRGLSTEGEFRYLEPSFSGETAATWLPQDQVAGRSRHAWRWRHEGQLPTLSWLPLNWGAGAQGWYGVQGERVSDDDWWKDFPRTTSAFTPRLLPLRAQLEHRWPWTLAGEGEASVYARTQRWQVLQSLDAPIARPYDRSAQAGLRITTQTAGWLWGLETELNRFTLPDEATSAGRPTGTRWHALGSLAYPWRQSGVWLTPRLSFNAAAYDLDQSLPDGRQRLSRTIPTVSVDMGLELDRRFEVGGRPWQQTLEPRLMWVRTPWRAQSPSLSFDSAGKDFSVSSIFSDNAFSGVDRVSDANQIDLGVVSRVIDATRGSELLRLGLVQRLQLADQQITPEGTPSTRRVSDLMLIGSTSVVSAWNLDATVRYNADIQRPVRAVLSSRYSPGEYQTFNASYRYTRGASEQLEAGWQWPIARWSAGTGVPALAVGGSGGSCSGQLYSVGRVNYSAVEKRITDSIAGFEFDAGCWIARVVAERLSTGRSEATTRLLLQLELVGLSRLGSNPLRVLKDNIPGYQLLRGDRTGALERNLYD